MSKTISFPQRVNSTTYASNNRILLKVMCPNCNHSGGHDLSYQPKCHICNYSVYMEPASNNRIECTWNEFKKYIENKKNIG